MSTAALFPETDGRAAPSETLAWAGTSLCKWGHPRVTARLVPAWTASKGWAVGWFTQVGDCVDEWHPAAPHKHRQHAAYPGCRLDELPSSSHFAVAAGNATRALKIVLEQMLGYADPALHAEVRELQQQMERQAQDWLCGRAC